MTNQPTYLSALKKNLSIFAGQKMAILVGILTLEQELSRFQSCHNNYSDNSGFVSVGNDFWVFDLEKSRKTNFATATQKTKIQKTGFLVSVFADQFFLKMHRVRLT